MDIRPPEAFQDYALPGATNVELAEVLSNPAFLTGAGPLIIVDRDGSLAMMVAGILSQKTKRPIKALHGGLDGFWEETELKSAVRAVPLPGGSPPRQPRRRPRPHRRQHLPPRRRRRRHQRRNRPVAEGWGGICTFVTAFQTTKDTKSTKSTKNRLNLLLNGKFFGRIHRRWGGLEKSLHNTPTHPLPSTGGVSEP